MWCRTCDGSLPLLPPHLDDTPASAPCPRPPCPQVEDLVAASREHEAAARAAELAVLGSSSREGRAAAATRRQHSAIQD